MLDFVQNMAGPRTWATKGRHGGHIPRDPKFENGSEGGLLDIVLDDTRSDRLVKRLMFALTPLQTGKHFAAPTTLTHLSVISLDARESVLHRM